MHCMHVDACIYIVAYMHQHTCACIARAGEFVEMTQAQYYTTVNCPMQMLRDWLLTDTGCSVLTSKGLQCYNTTSLRPGCVGRNESNSCEPFPVPQEDFVDLVTAAVFVL